MDKQKGKILDILTEITKLQNPYLNGSRLAEDVDQDFVHMSKSMSFDEMLDHLKWVLDRERETRVGKKVHYLRGGCARAREGNIKFHRILTTEKIEAVNCSHCLRIIRKQGLQNISDFPDMPIFKAKLSRHHAYFTCPVCGQENYHGPGSGHRVSHCDCWPKGYRLNCEELDSLPWKKQC